jgi:hypothetical protein
VGVALGVGLGAAVDVAGRGVGVYVGEDVGVGAAVDVATESVGAGVSLGVCVLLLAVGTVRSTVGLDAPCVLSWGDGESSGSGVLVSSRGRGVRVDVDSWAGLGARTNGHVHLHTAVFPMRTSIGSINLANVLFPKGYTVVHSSGRGIGNLVMGLVLAGLCYGGKD